MKLKNCLVGFKRIGVSNNTVFIAQLMLDKVSTVLKYLEEACRYNKQSPKKDKYKLKACPVEYIVLIHEVSVFKPNYSLYQIIQLVLFYMNILSEDLKLSTDVAWEIENSRVPQVTYQWKIYIPGKSQCLKPIHSLTQIENQCSRRTFRFIYFKYKADVTWI